MKNKKHGAWVLAVYLLALPLGSALGSGAVSKTASKTANKPLPGEGGAGAVVAILRTDHPGASIVVLGEKRFTDPITGSAFTEAHVQVDGERRVVYLDEASGTILPAGVTPDALAQAALSRLPAAYGKLRAGLYAEVRKAHGGALGGEALTNPRLSVEFYTDSADGLDKIASEIGAVPSTRYDEVQTYKDHPPVDHAADAGTTAAAAPPVGPPVPAEATAGPQAHPIRAIAVELPLTEVLRVGALDAVTSIEPHDTVGARLDNSVPRIHADALHSFGLNGLGGTIAILDSGIDRTHPAFGAGQVPVELEMDFAHSRQLCDAGQNQGLICDCEGGACGGVRCAGGASSGKWCVCPYGGACNPVTGLCVGGTLNGQACTTSCTGGTCVNYCEGGTKNGAICSCPGSACGAAGHCLAGPAAGMACSTTCPGGKCEGACSGGGANGELCGIGCAGVCESAKGDTSGHGTHVAGIAANMDPVYRGVGWKANLLNAKILDGSPPGKPAVAVAPITGMAFAWARQNGAMVANGSFGLAGICTAPPASGGRPCLEGVDCGAGGFCAFPGHCSAPPASVGSHCLTNAACGAGGVCFAGTPTSDGSSLFARQVDHEVYGRNVLVSIAAEELDYTSQCRNDPAAVCETNADCPANHQCVGGSNAGASCADPSDCGSGDCEPPICHAVPSTPNDAFNAIVVGASDLSVSPSVPADFSMSGQTSDGRSKPDVLAPGAAGNVCQGGDNDGLSCDVFDCTSTAAAAVGCTPALSGLCIDGLGGHCTRDADCVVAGASCRCGCGDGIDSLAHDWEGANPDYVDMQGTSMAAPHVSGLAALLIQYGKTQGLVHDTPAIKAVILNNAAQLADWRHSSVRPLDRLQGAGEIDALATYRAYADDLRVWQEKVTGTGAANFHWYWMDVTSTVAKIVVTLVFERHIADPAANPVPLNNLDLHVWDPLGSGVGYSFSFVDNVEHVVATPTVTGRYCIAVEPISLAQGGSELYALAANGRLHFTGTVNPCKPDFGDAPDPNVGSLRYPTLKWRNGARHLDWTKEWLGTTRPEIPGELRKNVGANGDPPYTGATLEVSQVDPFPSVSGEDDADDTKDQDGVPNLTDKDKFDDGVTINPPFAPGQPSIVSVTVQTTVNDTGVGPLGRYDASVPGKRLYLNAWVDWNGNGAWSDPGDTIIDSTAIDPETWGPNGRYTIGEPCNDANGSGVCDPKEWDPNQPGADTVGATSHTYTFNVTPPAQIAKRFYSRFRLDYGENAGRLPSASPTLSKWLGEAQFGEVEDYVHTCGTVPDVPSLYPQSSTLISWTPVPGENVTYDLLRGTRASLPVGSAPAWEACLTQYAYPPTFLDTDIPPAGEMFWYLARPRASCGAAGRWGLESSGAEERSETCAFCIAAGSACGADNQCCMGACLGGVCQGGCTPNSGSCFSSGDCCGGNCQGGICCAVQGSSCGGNGECCAGFCSGGYCANGCIPNAGTCVSSGQCCSGTCQGGACCGASGSSCMTHAQCCSGSCVLGVCHAGCLPNGYVCSFGTCCSGNCPGDTCCGPPGSLCNGNGECCAGVCNAGICESTCKPNTLPCTSGSQCCSLNCNGGFCQACAPIGGLCAAHEQCCSHFCQGGVCQP